MARRKRNRDKAFAELSKHIAEWASVPVDGTIESDGDRWYELATWNLSRIAGKELLEELGFTHPEESGDDEVPARYHLRGETTEEWDAIEDAVRDELHIRAKMVKARTLVTQLYARSWTKIGRQASLYAYGVPWWEDGALRAAVRRLGYTLEVRTETTSVKSESRAYADTVKTGYARLAEAMQMSIDDVLDAIAAERRQRRSDAAKRGAANRAKKAKPARRKSSGRKAA